MRKKNIFNLILCFRYDKSQIFENEDCEECMCLGEGQLSCSPKECPPCSGTQHTELSLSCECVCKECAIGERLCSTSNICLAEEKWCDGIEHCIDDEIGCDSEELGTTPAFLPGI